MLSDTLETATVSSVGSSVGSSASLAVTFQLTPFLAAFAPLFAFNVILALPAFTALTVAVTVHFLDFLADALYATDATFTLAEADEVTLTDFLA